MSKLLIQDKFYLLKGNFLPNRAQMFLPMESMIHYCQISYAQLSHNQLFNEAILFFLSRFLFAALKDIGAPL